MNYMKNFKQIKLISMLLAEIGISMSLNSCQKNDMSNVTLGAATNSPTSSITKGELNGLDFTWCSGDKLEVYYGKVTSNSNSVKNTTFSIVEKDNYTSTETFEGSVQGWNSAFDFCIIYPVNTKDAASEDPTSIVTTFEKNASMLTLTLPSNQIQQYDAENNINPQVTEYYDYKLSFMPAVEPTEHLANTTLDNLMTLVDVNVSNIPAGTEIQKVVIRSNNDIFPTEYDFHFDNLTGEYLNNTSAFSLTLLDSSSNTYTSDGTTLNARFLMYPFSVTASDEFYIDVYTADRIYTIDKTGMALDFVAGDRNTSNIDLLAIPSETIKKANSYIVAPGSKLTIPVNVRGNGGDVVNTSLSTSIDPASVGIVWETSPNLISLGTLSDDKKVSITAGSESGNAVIAAYSGADHTGDILWSWHIWVTNYNPSLSSSIMDRNLGATTATPGEPTTLGLFYQWGRKDPFPGSTSITEAAQPILYNPSSSIGSVSMIANNVVVDPVNLPNTILNPSTFYSGLSTNMGDWYSSIGSTHNNMLWNDANKTIFDPCPAGWRVPKESSSATQWSSLTLTNSEWSDENRGCTYNGMFYPAAGQISYIGNPSDVGNSGCYWTSTTNSSYVRTMILSKNLINLNTNYSRAYALSVRCVKE